MAQFFTAFSEYTADAQPSDWTERWNTGDGAANVRDSGIPGSPSTGGSHALEVAMSSGSLYALSWDDVGTPSGDVQVLALGYFEHTVDISSVLRVFLHGSGAAGSENCYLVDFNFGVANELRLFEYDGGSVTSSGSSDEGLTRNQWIWIRFDRSSSTIRLRAWEDGTSEPGTWAISLTDSTHSSGWAGLGSFNADGTSWFAQIGVGTGGDEAPATAFGITSVTPSSFADNETGVTIAGEGFEASQGTGKVELGDSDDYGTATLVEQTVTSWGDTSIDFTVDAGALSAGTVYVFVTNDSGDTTAGFTATLTAPEITTTTLPDASLSQAYSETLAATGGLEPYSWSVTVGTLPSGLTLNSSTGEISGTPDTDEEQTFTVQVTDDNSDTDTQELTITVVVAGTGTIYRRQDSNNYWRVRLDSGTAYLEKVDAGMLTLVDSAPATFDADSKLKVLASGSRHRVYIDDVLVLDATDSHLSDATGVGLYSEDDTTVGVESIYVYRA